MVSAAAQSAINTVSNAVSIVSVGVDRVSNAVSNEISNRKSASADLENHINAVSNAISVVSATVATNKTNLDSISN